MILESISIINYRSCKNLIVDLKEGIPNVFIGINDCGKSTILQAAELLLGEKAKYNAIGEGQNKSDLSNTPESEKNFNKVFEDLKLPEIKYDSGSTYILGKLVFTDAEAENFGNTVLSPGLQWSLENSSDSTLFILKVFSKDKTVMYLLSKDDKKGNQLWAMTQANLDKHINSLGVTEEDIKNENGKGRFSKFEKLRAAYQKSGTIEIWAEHKFAKNDKDILPEFKYFDWNCSFEDINSLANAIMKEHIDVHLTPLKEQAKAAADLAEEKINKEFDALSETIRSVAKGVENINSKVHFDVKEKVSDIMLKKSSSDGLIHLENQGEGLKRQIWFSLIKSKAETKPEDDVNKFIWAFDEPETHLFPAAQREFFDILKTISNGNVQTLISTHSTVFVDKSKLETIQSASQNKDGYTELSLCSDVEDIYSTLGVKNSDFLFFNKFLVVEGDTEQYLIPRLFELYTKSTLIDCNIQLINIQGKDKWLLNKSMLDKIMSGFKKSDDQIIYLFDKDMSFEIGAAAIKNNMFFVGDQDIEDSLSTDVWIELLNNKYDGSIVFTAEEINQLKEEIPKDQKCNSNQKFYPRLKKLTRAKWEESGHNIYELEQIPSKGPESAEFLKGRINDVEQIPEQIRLAFDKLIENNEQHQNQPEAEAN